MYAPRSPVEILRRKLTRRMMRTIKTFDLLEPNDKIMVAVSGGKDSYTMLDLLWGSSSHAPSRLISLRCISTRDSQATMEYPWRHG